MVHPFAYEDTFAALLNTGDLALIRRLVGNPKIPFPTKDKFSEVFGKLLALNDEEVTNGLLGRFASWPAPYALEAFNSFLATRNPDMINRLIKEIKSMPPGTVSEAFKRLFDPNNRLIGIGPDVHKRIRSSLCMEIGRYSEPDQEEIIGYLKQHEYLLDMSLKWSLNRGLGADVFSTPFKLAFAI